MYYTPPYEECSGSVVESLTQDQKFTGSSLTVDNALCPWRRHFILCLVLGDLVLLSDWGVKNQNKQNTPT